jgi:hypothetical protein
MRKLFLLTLSLIAFQTPAFAQVKLSNQYLYKLGEANGMAYCIAIIGGARNDTEIVEKVVRLNKAEVNYLNQIQPELTDKQWNVVTSGMRSAINELCRVDYKIYQMYNPDRR